MTVGATVAQNEAIAEAAERQQQQINDQAAERTNTRMEEARALRASLRASAAEAAVSGNSVSILADDIMAQAGRDVSLIEKNRKNGVVASDAEARARIRASNAEAVAGVGQAGINYYSSYLDQKKLTIPNT